MRILGPTSTSGLKVYRNTKLVKEECINHVSKRLGTALRKLKKPGVSLGGHGHGKLTDNVINRLQMFYNNAIHAHQNELQEMQDAIFASFEHASSTDERPNHDHCPKGKNSWCFYQRAQAEGKEPGDHRTNIGTALSPEVAAQVKPIYECLGHTDLLSRGLKGATQNANESLHAMVWAKCPKTGFVGIDRVLFATCCAVGEFNCGAQVTIGHLYGAMGLATGQQLISSAAKADRKKLGKSLRQEATRPKEARRARKLYTVVDRDYGPGKF